MQDHICFSDSLQKQSHNLHLFSRLPAEAKSPLFEFVDMLILCKCKITFVLALDPLQKQDLGLHLFFRLPAEAKSPLFEFVDMLILCKCKITFVLALDPLQKQGLGHHLLFTPRESKVTNTLRDPLQKQDLRISFWHVTWPKQNQCLCLYLIFTLIIRIFLKLFILSCKT